GTVRILGFLGKVKNRIWPPKDPYMYDRDYAPLFGRWHFHEKIPLVRSLWKYRFYRSEFSPYSYLLRHLWVESVESDYPLHRGLRVTQLFFLRIVDTLLRLLEGLLNLGPRWLWWKIRQRHLKEEDYDDMGIYESRLGSDSDASNGRSPGTKFLG